MNGFNPNIDGDTIKLLDTISKIKQGEKGDKGDTFLFSDLTEEEKLSLKGEQGLRGPMGERRSFSDLTENEKKLLKGDKGDKGDKGQMGPKGNDSKVAGPRGDKGEDGADGKSAYQIALRKGFIGSENAWLKSLKGDKGDKGDTGLSAFELAKKNGFKGTEAAWLQTLKGKDGSDGKSIQVTNQALKKHKHGVLDITGLTELIEDTIGTTIIGGTGILVTYNDITGETTIDATGGGGGTWGSITGTLSDQTDLQTALDGKVDENAPIAGATKTKITYDAKGLVTGGADATTADIADSSNKRYVTDAQLTILGNTSGSNSGDVTVTDSAEIDFTLAGQNITASLMAGSIDETKLDASVNASLDLADSALQSGDNISELINDAGYTTNTGTVTSVAISGSDGLEVDSGSPITTNGTIALGVNKTNLLTHLNVEDGADVTDATNVAAAGAFMKAADDITDITGSNRRVFYTDGSGVINELALGANGTVLTSSGTTSAPTFSTPTGGGDVSKVGTPVNNQIAVRTGDGTVEGTSDFTWDSASNILSLGDGAGGTTTIIGSNAVGATSNGTSLEFYGGSGGATSGHGGGFYIFGGSALGGNSNGGEIYMVGGTKTGSGVSGSAYLAEGNEVNYIEITPSRYRIANGFDRTYQMRANGVWGILDFNGVTGSDKTFTLPNATGTIALTSDITGTNSGTNTGDQNLFSTIAVSGQSNVVADSTGDTLTLVAGTNVTITTDAGTDAITINASGGGTPGGSDTQFQYNNGGAFGGIPEMTWNDTTKSLDINTASDSSLINIICSNTAETEYSSIGMVEDSFYFSVQTPSFITACSMDSTGVYFTSTSGVGFNSGDGTYNFGESTGTYNGIFDFDNITANRTYTLPNASGTIALTSDITVTPTSTNTLTNKTITGSLPIAGTSAGPASLSLAEDTDNGTNKITIQAPASLAGDYTLTLPADDGASGNYLKTDGSGALSWDTPAAGSGSYNPVLAQVFM